MIFMTVLLPIEANEGIEERLNVSLSRNEGRAVPVRRWSKRAGVGLLFVLCSVLYASLGEGFDALHAGAALATMLVATFVA